MSAPDPVDVDLDVEREIDLGRVARRVLKRWWLVVAAAAAGAAIGFAVSSGGGTVFQARATVYLGQPLSATGAAQLQSFQTNPSVVNAIAKSDEVIDSVAGEVGLRPGRLRSGVSTKPVSGSIARLGQTPLVEVVVRSSQRDASQRAADLIADEVVARVSVLAQSKIETLTEQLADYDRQIAEADRFLEAQNALRDDAGLPATARAIIASQLWQAEVRRGIVLENRLQADLSLGVATDVERGQVVTRASATKVAARSRRSGTVVGGVIGIVAGVLAALVLPTRTRRGPQPAPDAAG